MSSHTGISFADGIRLQKLDDRTFRATLDPNFAIGNVVNGGFSSACVLAAAGAYLDSRKQPDTMTAHFEFISMIRVGPVIITVEDVKLGRQLSTLHLTLWQGRGMLEKAPWVTPSVTKRAILAYATQTDLATFTGESLPTGFQHLDAKMRPVKPDLVNLLEKGGDDVWRESVTPKPVRSLLRANYTWRYFVPKGEPFTPGVLDMWLTPRNGEPITQAMLPYIVDSFPYDMHTFLMDPQLRRLLFSSRTQKGQAAAAAADNDSKRAAEREELIKRDKERGTLWFPTVVMNLENKTLLPKAGVQWLNVRVTSKLMDNGKFDLDIMVRDEGGRTVALSHHVALIVSMDRNTGGGGGSGGDGKKEGKKGRKSKASL